MTRIDFFSNSAFIFNQSRNQPTRRLLSHRPFSISCITARTALKRQLPTIPPHLNPHQPLNSLISPQRPSTALARSQMLPSIKRSENSFESIQLFCRRAEARALALLTDFSKFAMRLSKQINLSTSNATSTRDIGYWETELLRREKDITTILKLFNTTVVLLLIYPNAIPGQEHEEFVQYLEPDSTGHFPDPLSFVNPEHQHHQPFTPQQITATRRHLSILNDITIDFFRNKELCQSSLNRMHLFTPQRANDKDDEDDEYEDGDVSGTDIESQLITSDGNKKKNKHKSGPDKNHQALNSESALIQDSLQQSQFAINNALASQASLGRQRDIFQNVISRVSALTSTRLPGITETLNGIQNRRQRDNCILATLIAFCVFISLIYLSWKHR